MKYDVRVKIYSDINLLRFLRENSYFIKFFSRRGDFNEFENLMKKQYSLTFKDKVNKLQVGANLLRAFFETSK